MHLESKLKRIKFDIDSIATETAKSGPLHKTFNDIPRDSSEEDSDH